STCAATVLVSVVGVTAVSVIGCGADMRSKLAHATAIAGIRNLGIGFLMIMRSARWTDHFVRYDVRTRSGFPRSARLCLVSNDESAANASIENRYLRRHAGAAVVRRAARRISGCPRALRRERAKCRHAVRTIGVGCRRGL